MWTGDAQNSPPVPLDAAGEIVPAALRALGKGGTLAVAGIHMSEIPLRPWVTTFPFSDANDALSAVLKDGLRSTAVLVP